LSDILITYHSCNIIPRKITNIISKIFNISNNAVIIFILSLISGFPSNGIIINKAIDNNNITHEEGNHLLLFCNFANPLFILETVGTFYLKNTKYATIILISHILSNIIIGIIYRRNNHPKNNYIIDTSKSQSFNDVLSNSIYKSVKSLLLIAGTVTLFLILTTLITHIFNLNNYLTLFIKSILEMTMALSYLANLNISNTLKIVLSSIIISFSGLSVHLQVISSLDNIKYKNYLLVRIISSILSGIISYLIIVII
ncbi:MAG: hypothetical protein IKI04_00855, partial [Bacilli bacterium]|nr:hypothetical protein [Bacilli bacterium]